MQKAKRTASEEHPPKSHNITVETIWDDPLYGLDDLPDEGEDNALDADEAIDDRFDGPNDADDYDEDGVPLGEGADDEEENQFVDYKENADYEEGPTLNKAKMFEIRVLLRDRRYVCEYRPMPWQERGDRFQVAKRADFLRVCARWLTTRKQLFLASRQLEDYFEDDMKDPPLTEQKGFLERINPMLERPLPDEKDDKKKKKKAINVSPPIAFGVADEKDDKKKKKKAFLSSVGRILPSIYLVWDDGISLPLNALFGKEAKQCRETLRQACDPQGAVMS